MYSWLVSLPEAVHWRSQLTACPSVLEQMAPEALPSGYRRWITNASKVAEPCLPVNLEASRYGRFDPDVARKAINWKTGATPRNQLLIEQYASNAEKVRERAGLAEGSIADDARWTGRLRTSLCSLSCRPPVGRHLHLDRC